MDAGLVQIIVAIVGSHSLSTAVGIWLRRSRKRSQAVVVDAAMARPEFVEHLTKGGQEMVNWFRAEFVYLREQVASARAEAADAQKEAASSRQESAEAARAHAECEGKLEAVRSEVAAFMASSRVAYPDEPVPEHLKTGSAGDITRGG